MNIPTAAPPFPTASTAPLFSLPLLAQTDLLLTVARLFRPPAADFALLIGDMTADTSTLIHAALPAVHGAVVQKALTALVETIATTPMEELVAEYVRLFEGEPACPPNETAYIRRDKGALLGDIAGFYHAFGVTTARGEKPDHVVAELEFMAVLLVMQAKAVTAEEKKTAHDALAAFVVDHVGDWLPSFAARLTAVANLPVYRQIASLLAVVWTGMAITQDFTMPEILRESQIDSEESLHAMACDFGHKADPTSLHSNTPNHPPSYGKKIKVDGI